MYMFVVVLLLAYMTCVGCAYSVAVGIHDCVGCTCNVAVGIHDCWLYL